MSDLEKFLQQAAERMKERMREQQGGKKQAGKKQGGKQQGGQQPLQRPVSVRQSERAAPRAEEPEILEAEIVEPSLPKSRQQRSEQIGNIRQRKPPVTENVELADERMAERMHQVFDHNLGQLSQNKMTAVNNASPAASLGLTNQSSEVDRREQATSPLIEVLRQPENLKAAFIVGEIFKRKF